MDGTKHDVVVYYNGSKTVVKNVSIVTTNKVHREDGPALLWDNGTTVWIQHGKHHRMDGPSSINSIGRQRWCIRGRDVTKKVNQWLEDNGIDPLKFFQFNDLDDQTAVCFLSFMLSLEGKLT